ncbi:MAG: methyltransferase domain-containing protein [Opitutaceae bacterium]|nr:methyltransferase domain-containing protein [Opitutaceae bacterium]
MSEDPTAPGFWNERYLAARTPWDFGGVPPPLARYLATHPGRGATVLIPGCGSGYETAAFAQAGYRVTAIDFSPPAVAKARATVGPALADRIIEGDLFAHPLADAPFDFIYERTFLCALPPAWRERIVARTAELLKPGGTLGGIYFFEQSEDGPPFGLGPGEADRLFDAGFKLVRDEPVAAGESLAFFAGRERWQERTRRMP